MSRTPNKRSWVQKPDKPVPMDTRHWLYPYLKIVTFPGIGQYRNMIDDGFAFNTSIGSVNAINGNRVRRYAGTSGAVDRGTFNQSVNNGAGFITRVASNVPINGSAITIALTFNTLTCLLDHTAAGSWQWAAGIKANGVWNPIKFGSPPGAGDMATVAGVWDDNTKRLSAYQDGRLTGLSPNLGLYNTDSLNVACIGSGLDGANNNAYYASMDMDFMCYFEGIVPTEAQILSLSNNPWQLLQPRIMWIPASVPVGIIKTFFDNGISTDVFGPVKSRSALMDLSQATDVSPALNATLGFADTAISLDALNQSALLSLLDASTGNDAQQLAVSVASLDVSSAVDSVTLLTDIIKTIADAAYSTDALAGLNASLAMADVGIGVDQLAASILCTLTDDAGATDAILLLQEVLKTFADSGAGNDALSIAVSVPMTDSGTGIDALSITALLAIIDRLNGIDAIVKYDTASRIATITFSLASRSIDFDLT